MSSESQVVYAAGAVLWRQVGKKKIELAVIHRPRYDDWSLPKGKLDPNETMFDYEDIKDDLTYYVIESKSGKYLPDSLLTMNEPPYEYVYNGFSKGYAVSRNANLIVYWLIIW